MSKVPVITLEHLSKPDALLNLLEEYPSHEQQEAILGQLLKQPIIGELPRLVDIKKFVELFSEHWDLIAQKLLTPAMLQSFSQGYQGLTLIVALAQAFPTKKDEIAVKILHLDTFKVLAESAKDVKALIDEFPMHKNGIAHLVFSKEIFQALTKNPNSINSLINLFPELPDYATLIPHLVKHVGHTEGFFSTSTSLSSKHTSSDTMNAADDVENTETSPSNRIK